jgi:hypothetical protein
VPTAESKAFGMKFDTALGRALVADKVKIVINVEAVKEAYSLLWGGSRDA